MAMIKGAQQPDGGFSNQLTMINSQLRLLTMTLVEIPPFGDRDVRSGVLAAAMLADAKFGCGAGQCAGRYLGARMRATEISLCGFLPGRDDRPTNGARAVNKPSSAGPSPTRTARCNRLKSSLNRPSIVAPRHGSW